MALLINYPLSIHLSMRKIGQCLFLFLLLLISQQGMAQPTMQDVLKKGEYQTISADFETFVDAQIKNTYEGDLTLIVLEEGGKMYCAILPALMASYAYNSGTTQGGFHHQSLFFTLNKSSGKSRCDIDFEVKTYISAGTSLNEVCKVRLLLDFCYKGKGYSIKHQSW